MVFFYRFPARLLHCSSLSPLMLSAPLNIISIIHQFILLLYNELSSILFYVLIEWIWFDQVTQPMIMTSKWSSKKHIIGALCCIALSRLTSPCHAMCCLIFSWLQHFFYSPLQFINGFHFFLSNVLWPFIGCCFFPLTAPCTCPYPLPLPLLSLLNFSFILVIAPALAFVRMDLNRKALKVLAEESGAK